MKIARKPTLEYLAQDYLYSGYNRFRFSLASKRSFERTFLRGPFVGSNKLLELTRK